VSLRECSRDDGQDDADAGSVRREVLDRRISSMAPRQLADDGDAEPRARAAPGRVPAVLAIERVLEATRREARTIIGDGEHDRRAPIGRSGASGAQVDPGRGVPDDPVPDRGERVLDQVGEDSIDGEPVRREGQHGGRRVGHEVHARGRRPRGEPCASFRDHGAALELFVGTRFEAGWVPVDRREKPAKGRGMPRPEKRTDR